MFDNVVMELTVELDGETLKTEFDPQEIKQEDASRFNQSLIELASHYGITKLRFNATGKVDYQSPSTKAVRSVFGLD